MKISKIYKLSKGLFFVALLYVYLYNPLFQFLGFGIIKFILLISLLFLLLSKHNINLFVSKFAVEIYFVLVLVSYSFLVYAFSGPAGRTMISYHLFWFLEGFVISAFILTVFKDYFLKYDFLDIMIFIGFIASIVSLFLILNPNINFYVRENIIVDALDLFNTRQSDVVYDYRGFSIAESSSFIYGVTQGVILGFCFFKLKDGIIYIIPTITILISILFNARIGLYVALTGLILFILLRTKLSYKIKLRKKNLSKIAFLLTVLSILFVFLKNSTFVSDNTYTLEWAFSTFNQTIEFITGSNSNSNVTLATIFGDMWFLPSTLTENIFGRGENIYLNAIRNSDVGYIIQIFEGGFLYLLLMLLYLFFMYFRIRKHSNNTLIPLFFLITILISNFKGNSLFVSSGFFRLFMLYYVLTILSEKQFKIKKIKVSKQ